MKMATYRVLLGFPGEFQAHIRPEWLASAQLCSALMTMLDTDGIISFWVRYKDKMIRFNKQDLPNSSPISNHKLVKGACSWNMSLSSATAILGGILIPGVAAEEALSKLGNYSISPGAGDMAPYKLFRAGSYYV